MSNSVIKDKRVLGRLGNEKVESGESGEITDDGVN